MSEGKLKKEFEEFLKELRDKGVLDFRRMRVGSVRGHHGSTNPISGWSDYTIFIYGQVVFAELKTKSGVQSPKQIEFERMVKRFGHRYFVIRSIKDAISMLKVCGILG
jgi:hypothetical protein